MSRFYLLASIIFCAWWIVLTAAGDLPKINPWCYNQTAAGYLAFPACPSTNR